MERILVFGHQNPDMDAIASAISFSYLANHEYQLDTEAVCLGEINDETKYALDYFNVKAPRMVTSAKEEGVKTVILTDHNEFQQSIADLADLKIWGVIDHHRISNFKTADPLYYRAEPVGSTCSIIAKMILGTDLKLPKALAGIMLSAIISDTLLFKSPTTHPTDRPIAEKLAKIAGVDLDQYGLEFLKSGTDTSSKSAEELVNLDAKTFPLGNYQVRIAQVNTVDINEVLNRQADLEQAMKVEINNNNYDDFILVITDILENNSELLVVGTNKDKIENAFGITLDHDHAFVAGVVSRKKQIVPPLTKSYEN